MKKIWMGFVIAAMVCTFAGTTVNAENTFGFNLGAAVPTGDFADAYENGFSAGAIANLDTASPIVDISLGINYSSFEGKTYYIYYGNEYKYDSTDLITIFVGPKFGKDKGFYFLPAIALNINEGDYRGGFDWGAGYLVPMGSGKTRVDIGVKYSLLNIIGNEDGEDTLGMFVFSVGINF
ncbi:MAG: hypothetical protein FP816_20325 [Desulfobacteraceae bacterium]|nr:hypothetical protein [Desulfobacteraceae bacterium]MBU4011426.1 hypothetical protein [Pseudomonadota bacterium]MBU4034993.1 hypothetical protein [Pseudomonadota bacterium]